MTAEILTVAVMITTSAVSTETCKKLDPVLWDYTSCPHPESKEWIQLQIKMNCDKDHDYHCAPNSQGCDVQLCVKRIYCEAGHYPLLDPDKNTVICAPCPPDRYQTIGSWSNERSYCEHEKTKCDSIGQIECQPGSTTTDRSCRCDIHQNWALQSYASHNKTCCTNNDPIRCECMQFKSPCPSGTVRHDNYKCLKECPPNLYRLWNSETCYPNSTTVTAETTPAHQTPSFGSTGLPDTVNVGLIVGVTIPSLALVGLIVGLCVYHVMRKRKKGRSEDEEQAVPLKEHTSGEVIVKSYVIIGRDTNTNITTDNLIVGDNNRVTITNYENPVTGNEDDLSSFESDAQGTSLDLPGETQSETSIIESSIGDSFMQDGEEYTSELPFMGRPESRDLRGGPFSTEEVDVSMNPEGETQNETSIIESSIGDSFMQDGEEYTSGLPFMGRPESRDLRGGPFSTEEVDVSMNPEGVIQREVSTIEPSLDGAFFHDGGEYTPALPFRGTPEFQDAHQRAIPFIPEEDNVPVQEEVPINPEESKQEESIRSDETSMDTKPKIPVEHDELDQDDQTKKKEVWRASLKPDDETKKKEVWRASLESDDETKRKEVWRASLESDDETKKKEVWRASLESDDETKKKEVWRASLESDETKKKEVWRASLESDDETKKKEVWRASLESDDETKKKEVWRASLESDETKKKEVWRASLESDDEAKKKEVWRASLELDDETKKKEVWRASLESDDETKKKEVWRASLESDDKTKKKEVWRTSLESDDKTKKKEVCRASLESDDKTKKKEPQIPGSDAERGRKTDDSTIKWKNKFQGNI